MLPKIKIEYSNQPQGIIEGSTTSINYKQPFVNFNDFKTMRVVPKYATLEEGRNKLDGTFINFPTTPQGYGYLSTLMTRANKTFSNNIVVTRTYNTTYSTPRYTNRVRYLDR